MKKAFVLGALAFGVLFGQVPAKAEDGESTLNKVTFKGEVRTRFEWNEHMFDPSSSADDSLTYFPYRVRLGIEGKFANNITGFAEFQNFGNFGGASPEKGVPIYPFYQSFSSGVAAFPGTSTNDTSWLYQGYVTLDKIGGSDFGVRLGRQEHTYGTELLLGDADFYSGVSFDGARGFWAPQNWRIDAFYYRTAQRNFAGTPTTASDGNLFGATLDYAISQEIGNVGGYVIVDQRPVYDVLTDNSRITTIGAHFVKLPSTSQPFDWNAEIAAQTGNNSGTTLPQELKYSGLVGEGWFGYSFGSNVRSRVHAGILYASGDGDIADNKDKNFQPLYGDPHAWNRLGNLDIFPLSNIFDINVGYTAAFSGGKHVLFGGVHVLSLDKVTAPGGSKGIGTELDVTYDYRMNKNLGFEVGIANLFPGDAVKDSAAPDSASDPMRLWAQAKLSW